MIKVGVVGYGNLGRGVHYALDKAEDFKLVGIFTRRDPKSVKPVMDCAVYSVEELKKFKGEIDILILCGGSATDLPVMTKELLKDFNTVDTFDTHANIPEYFSTLDEIGKKSDKLALISVGWDPGLFSIARLYFGSVLPAGNDYTFWGKGVSQGHSDAVRRIEGVETAIQYTIPKDDALESVRKGENPVLTARDKHLRECFVVLKAGADADKVEREIKEMPNYFKDYDTVVHFISREEFDKNHGKLSHGGFVLRTGNTTQENAHKLELSIKLDSNAEFTGSVEVAFARAAYRLYKDGKRGAITVFDVPPVYLSPRDRSEVIGSTL